MNAPAVQEYDLIQIGKPHAFRRLSAVIVQVDESGRVEVVYQSPSGRPIGEWVIWKPDSWEFERSGPCGTYAENSDRLRSYEQRLLSIQNDA